LRYAEVAVINHSHSEAFVLRLPSPSKYGQFR
jgi:hypothetical protein